MLTIRRVCFLIAGVLLASCASNQPLPEDEVPIDFLFTYEMDRENAPEPPPPPKAVVEKPPAKGAEKPEPAGVKPGTPAGKPGPAAAKPGTPPGKPGPAPTKPAGPRLGFVHIEIEVGGLVRYTVRYKKPYSGERSGELTLKPEELQRAYRAIREADLYDLEDRYEGKEPWLGTETYTVVGHNRVKEVVLAGTTKKELSELRNTIFDLVPAEKILSAPAPGEDIFVMDLRTKEIHPGTSPRVKDIPKEFRLESRHIEDLLDRGGWPSKECKPLIVH